MKMKVVDAIRSGNPATLFSAFLYFDVSFMVWVLLGALGVFISKDFGLSATQKGLLVALPILGGSILRIPMGILTERIGPKRTGIIGMVITLLPLFLGWLFATNLTQLMAVGLLLGVAGASFAVALPLASRWYPKEHQGLAMGIAGAGNSGTVLAALFAPRLAEYFGWQGVMGLAAIPVLITLLIFVLLAKDSPEQPMPKGLANYLALLKEKDTFRFCFFYSITFGGFVGLASFLVIFFHDQYGLSRVMAGNFAAICVFAGSFFRPFGGYLADRFGGVKMLTVLFAAIALLALGIAALPPLPIATALLFFVMLSLGMGNGSVFQLVPQRFRSEIGVATGVIGAAGGLGGFFLPAILGYSKDVSGSYGTGFALFALVSVLGLTFLQKVKQEWSLSWLKRVVISDLAPSGRVRMEVVFGG